MPSGGAVQAGLLPLGRVLSRLFRRRFLEELQNAHRAGQLKFFGEHIDLADADAFADWLMPLRQCEWVVYAKRPFSGPEQVLAYLSRYTHRVAISNSRLVALDDRGVTFRWKDYREHGRTRYKTMSLATEEFMRRFLLHVLPSGFHRIRHYGLLANANRQHDIAAARDLLHQPAPTPPAAPGDGAPITAVPGPPSCADIAARRCSSSRPSRALSTSVAHRVHRAHHDRHRVNQQHFHGGIFLNDAVANARGLVLQNVPLSARQSPLERTVLLRA